MSIGITVFTATYNRGYCIETLYQSLKRQTDKNFEWIVVDDGSTDNTSRLFDKWQQEDNGFTIIYKRVKNGGKMKAFNKGVELASAPAFFNIDSDDYIYDDALEQIEMWFEEIKNNESFAGISGLKKISTIDTNYDFDYVDATNLERRKYALAIDMAECYKTEVLRKYPAPEIEGEKYLSPSIIWNKIAKDGYKLRWHNRYIYVMDYQQDGLSAAGPDILTRNPIGWGKLIQLNIECKKDKDYTEFQYYRYYQKLKDKLSIDVMSEYLAADKDELLKIVSKKPEFILNVKNFFTENEIKQVALYGLGGEAKRFLQFSREFDIEICYGIDRRPNSLLQKCYKPTDNFPPVDAVLITNRMGISGIKDDLKHHTTIKCISIQEDILDKNFNYYFSDI